MSEREREKVMEVIIDRCNVLSKDKLLLVLTFAVSLVQ